MSKQLSIAAIALSASIAMSANAGPIPYPDKGIPAPTSSFTASSTGFVTAYFYDAWATYESKIGLWVNGVSTGNYGLMSTSSDYGDSFILGNVTAGDELVFELVITSLNPDVSWFSDPSLNSDGKNHTYSTDFGGGGGIPQGTYVSFEDLPKLGDLDFNDYQFVYTITPPPDSEVPVPEPLTLVLFGLGLAALGFSRKRKV